VKLKLKILSGIVVLPTLTILVAISCSGTRETGDASSSKNTASPTQKPSQAQAITTNNAATTLSPDPAFDRLLPTLRRMTTVPIMLPATLPPRLRSVAIGNDPNDESGVHTTGGNKYTILFLNRDASPPPDLSRIVQPYVNYKVSGTLTTVPAGSPPQPDPSRFRTSAKVDRLGTVSLPDGTVAGLYRVVPSEGANYVPFTIGAFEKANQRYTVSIEADSPKGNLTRQLLSTMVEASST
jgi:hypothetical protein